jgi:thioredoxin 1
MKKLLTYFLILSIALFQSCINAQNQNGYVQLSAADFQNKIKEMAQVPLLDVRTPDEFGKGHLLNAKNVDWNGSEFEKEIAKLDKSKPVFLYCLSGGRSGKASQKLLAEGFKEVYELNGGIMKWRAANLPETTESTTKTTGMTKLQFDALLENDKLVLIDFYADWCAPCQKMKPYLEEISKDMTDKVVVIRINADDNQSLLKELGVDALPVLQLYKKKEQLWNFQGWIAKEEVVSNILKH